MSKEYGTPPVEPVTVNPMRLPNTLHLSLGVFTLLMGGLLLLGVSNAEQVRSMGLGAAGRLLTGLTLLLLGGVHVGMAMRYFRFTVLPGQAGDIALPPGKGRNDHLVDLINDGIVARQRPNDPLLSMLYGLVPHLTNAPAAIRWHAETQLQRAVYLAAVLASFGLAWMFAQPAAFAWMAGVYFFIAVTLLRPFATFAAIRKGAMEPDATHTVPPPRWVAMVSLLFVSIAGPLAITLSPMQVPAPPFATATVVLPTLAVLGSALIASALFTVALIAQTRNYSASAARHIIHEDLQLPDLTAGLLDRIGNRLPYPNHHYAHDHTVGNDQFRGHLLVETEASVHAGQSASTLGQAFSSAWASEAQRPLLALGLFGLLLGLAGVTFAFIYARSSGVAMIGLIALGFISSAQFALASAHKLWNRVDFTSTLYRVSYKGTFHRAKRVAGNAIDGSGTLSEGAVRFGPTRVAICVAQLESVAFSRGGKRHITAVDLLNDECNAIYAVIQDYAQEAHARAGQFYEQEHQVRETLNHGARPPALPPLQTPQDNPITVV